MFEMLSHESGPCSECGLRGARVRTLTLDLANKDVCQFCALRIYGFVANLKMLRSVLDQIGAWDETGFVGEEAKIHTTVHIPNGRSEMTRSFFLPGGPEDIAVRLTAELQVILHLHEQAVV